LQYRRWRRWLLLAFFLIAVVGRFACALLEPRTPLLTEGPVDLVRVVDGDTLIVRQHANEFRVRLLGVNAPESVKPNHPVEPWGREASEWLRQQTDSGGLAVRLDKRRLDRYGRSLAYLYIDEQMLNEELVRAGLAQVSVFPGDSPTVTRQLRAAQTEAQEARRGVWSESSMRIER